MGYDQIVFQFFELGNQNRSVGILKFILILIIKIFIKSDIIMCMDMTDHIQM